jgi:hypothetical protein
VPTKDLRDDEDAADRVSLALELYALGEAMMRQRMIRESPTLPPAEIESRLVQWLEERPGAASGDTIGRACVWPRTAK